MKFRQLRLIISILLLLPLVFGGCFEDEAGEPFYGRVVVPRAREFRWSGGGLPRVFDPALAAAPPDTDAVRALFEGLTDYDPRTLAPVSAVATRWESTPDARAWTFYLRRDARWSNGEPVTAHDFVRSWRRTLRLGDRAPHARLMANIEGAQDAVALVGDITVVEIPSGANGAAGVEDEGARRQKNDDATSDSQPPKVLFGAQAVEDYVLTVRLQRPDKNFPSIVAHPVFRPGHALNAQGENNAGGKREQKSEPDGAQSSAEPHVLQTPASEVAGASDTVSLPLISNGAFRLNSLETDGVVLERAGSYWDAGKVALERVRFVASKDSESALAAYRAGTVDAVTNAAFEPLALKLLAPYEDFRRATYGALTYYIFNLSRPPFDDRRVREALSVALDRDRLCADTMNGATEPAKKFLPERKAEGEEAVASIRNKNSDSPGQIEHNTERARRLLAEAGFPGGAGFPRIRLLVNRNEQHRVMAQAVAAMWRQVLGVETEVVERSWDEYEAALWTGEYDVARRGIVMQTPDEESNMRALFEPQARTAAGGETAAGAIEEESTTGGEMRRGEGEEIRVGEKIFTPSITTEAQALSELPAFPVYFASSFALVKPYVKGFDTNLLDAPSLKHVRIDEGWKPPPRKEFIRVVSSR